MLSEITTSNVLNPLGKSKDKAKENARTTGKGKRAGKTNK
jgi:hypothetical protein